MIDSQLHSMVVFYNLSASGNLINFSFSSRVSFGAWGVMERPTNLRIIRIS